MEVNWEFGMGNCLLSVEEGADYGKGGERAEGAEVGGVVLDEEV